jgi:hypothetical protein
MKRFICLKIGVFVLFSLITAPTSFAWGRWLEPWLPEIPKVWTKVDPAEIHPDFEYKGLTPACSVCLTCMSDKFTPGMKE